MIKKLIKIYKTSLNKAHYQYLSTELQVKELCTFILILLLYMVLAWLSFAGVRVGFSQSTDVQPTPISKMGKQPQEDPSVNVIKSILRYASGLLALKFSLFDLKYVCLCNITIAKTVSLFHEHSIYIYIKHVGFVQHL